MLSMNIKSYNFNITLKKAVLIFSFFGNMKDKKKFEIQLNVIEIVYTKIPGLQKLIDK